jgi:hypothetical protein
MFKEMLSWTWQYMLTPIIMGIFFGIGNFSAYALCQSKPVKKVENKIYELVN